MIETESIMKTLNDFPSYSYDGGIIYQGDCLEIMPLLADKSVDLVLTDPPYGIDLDTDCSSMVSKLGNKSIPAGLRGKKYDKVVGDKDFDFLPFWEMVKDIRKHIYFGGDYFLPRDIFLRGSMSIWDKRLTDSADKMFGSCFETIWFLPRQKRDIIRYKWAGVFGMEKEKQRVRLHPTQKPIALMKRLLLIHSKGNDLILDPFMGSGTTGVACKELNRNFIGIEISKTYYDIACERIKNTTLPLNF